MATAQTRGFRVLVTGASGLLGRALVAELRVPRAWNAFSPQVLTAVRRPPVAPSEVFWDPLEGRIDAAKCEGLDAVVHLAGENIGSGDGGLSALTGAWSPRKKAAIIESRRRGTALLARALASLKAPPPVLVTASGVGFYGDAGEAVCDEASPRGAGFLADVSAEWEGAAGRAAAAGVRTVALRFGVVLSRRGGVVEKLYWPFFLGGGGPVGPGSQWVSWIALPDAVRAITHAIGTPGLAGPVNACSPQPARNADFMAALAGAMGRPCALPLPTPIVHAVFGEMGAETLLASTRAVPTKLLASGFVFDHPDVRGAMAEALRD